MIVRLQAFELAVNYPGSMNRSDDASRLPFPAVVVIAALTVFGLITMVQWLVGSIATILRFGLFLLIVLAIGSWLLSAKSRR